MADKKISALTAATTPLAGTEVLPIVQGGATVKVSAADVTAGRDVSAKTLTGESTGAGAVTEIFARNTAGPERVQIISRNTAGVSYVQTQNSQMLIGSFDNFAVQFMVNNASKVVLETNSDVKVSTGNLVIGTAAKGIDFSANPNAPGMTSELLNDYEEGTWTPTDGSGAGLTFTGTSGNCFYTKVGNLVTCVFGLVYPTTADLSGAKLAGLPFTSKATSNSVSGGFITYTNSALTITPLVGTNDTGVNLFLNTGTAAGNNQLSTFILRGIITYMV